MIETLAQLRALYAAPAERAQKKQQPQLDAHCQRFIALSPFCVLASAGAAQGALLDASPRGGLPGFARTPDAHTVLLPDAGGNNRLDTLTNLLADPRIGMLFIIPGVDETLRVNGTARLRDEAALTDLFAATGQRPRLVIEVRVAEAYLHCSKAFMRSRLWQPGAQQDRAVLPSMNQMIHDQMGLATPPETAAAMAERYRAQLAMEQQPGTPP
ncbi:MAG: pyridoxamine 5'-phosphate oxidase family protein [Acidovorax sp.]|uniref:pyridoxamine 5'-phosphate oxidase family protein n=1 Tax=Acidovorax sp. TaxID=1872122 RepID=UPI00260E95CD|nr:pyridoxamine 5'-phosphate oxidase family protein [Acidovorax sp.]MDH4427769.1 pyridoxamine 5'-phosphate oxidase family protein [Acidovorax sp.]